MNPEPLRVIIRVCVTDIPATPCERVFYLGRDFCEQILKRPFNIKLQDDCHDAMHYLPNFDSENAVRAWFLYDFNVTGQISKEGVLDIAHNVYLATRKDDSWIFTPRKQWVTEGKKYCSMYKWGATYTTVQGKGQVAGEGKSNKESMNADSIR